MIQRLWLKLGQKFQGSFYLYLAALFTLVVLADGLVLNITAGLRQSSFDLMIKHRLVVGKPDPDIVIVDINEASLAAMAKEYGRWPWPRQVMSEFLEQVEKRQPKAVILDFSIARLYTLAARKALEKTAVTYSRASTGDLYAALLLLKSAGGNDNDGEKQTITDGQSAS